MELELKDPYFLQTSYIDPILIYYYTAKKKVYALDLKKGQIVHEWRLVHEIHCVSCSNKYICITYDSTSCIYDWNYTLLLEIEGFKDGFSPSGPVIRKKEAFSPCNKYFIRHDKVSSRIFNLEKIFKEGLNKVDINYSSCIDRDRQYFNSIFSPNSRYILSQLDNQANPRYLNYNFVIDQIEPEMNAIYQGNSYHSQWSPNSKYLVLYNGTCIQVMNFETKKIEHSFKGGFGGPIKWLDENHIISCGYGLICIRSLNTRTCIRIYEQGKFLALEDEFFISLENNIALSLVDSTSGIIHMKKYSIPTRSLEKLIYSQTNLDLIDSNLYEIIFNFIPNLEPILNYVEEKNKDLNWDIVRQLLNAVLT